MKRLSSFELGWLVALLEGEGCFDSVRTGPNRRGPYPRVRVTSTDRDVLERAVEITGVGRIYTNGKPRPTWKQAWSWFVSSSAAIEIARLVYPHLCERRRGQIDKMLEAVETQEDKLFASG